LTNDYKVVNEAMEQAGARFGRFINGLMSVVDEVSEKAMPVLENMLVRMAEAWAERVVEKNT